MTTKRIDDILDLIAISPSVEIKFTDGRICRATVQAHTQEMSEGELARFIMQIGERFQHGELKTQNVEGKLVVSWTESVIIGERR